jgi:hypothetical protein
MTLEERERLMIAKLATMTDKNEVQRLLANANRLKATKLATACVNRLAELGTPTDKHPLVQDWWRRLVRSEEDQRQFTPGFRHSRTRQMFQKREAAGMDELAICIELNIVSVRRTKPSSAFMRLAELGLLEYADEMGVINFASEYPPEVVAIARQRLADYGVITD